MGLRLWVSACALAMLTCVSEAWAAACNGGNCPAANFVVTGIVSPESAGTVSSVIVEVRTSAGARATGYTGKIHFTSTDPQATLPADYTFTSSTATTPNCTTGCDQGIHTFTNGVVLKTAATQSVTATDVSKSTVKGSQTGIVVQATTASRLVVSGIATPRTAGTASSVTVEVKDAYGNRITNYTGTITFSSSDSRATLPANYPFTSGTGLDNGIHTFSSTNGVTLKTSGSQSVTATDTLNASLTGSQSGIQVNAAAASTLVVSGIPSPQSQNTTSLVAVEARDAFGNRATTYTGTVKFTSTDPQAALPANYKFTSGSGLDNGFHTFAPGVTLKTAGTQSVTATDTVTASITGAQTGIVVVSNAATTLVVSGVTSPQIAGTTSSVRVEARDAAGNLARSYTGTVRISTSDAQATRPADHTFTTTDAGVFTFPGLVLKTAATQSVTATDIANGSINGSQAGGVVVTPAPAAKLVVGGISAPVTAGVTATFTVEARDAFNNRATAYLGTVAFTTSDAQGTVPAPHPFTSADAGFYSGDCVLRTVPSQSLSAADTANPAVSPGSINVTVNPSSAVRLTLTGIPGVVTAGDPSSATVTAYDAYNNIATGYLGTVHFSSSDVRASVPPDRAFLPGDLGLVTVPGVVLVTAATQRVSAADTLTPSLQGIQPGIIVNPGSVSSLNASGFPSPTAAGSVGALNVTAYDAYENVATGYTGTVTFSSSDAQATLPSPTTFTGGDAGSRWFSITLNTAGPQSISVTDGMRSGEQPNISVVPGTAAQLVVNGIATPIPSGQPASVTVEALDAQSNRVTAYAGTVSFTSSDARATLPAPYAFTSSDSGIHVFSNAVMLVTAGTQSVTATDGTISGTQGGISVTDTTAPTWPTGSTLTAVATSTSTAHLSWTAATDNVGVTAYRLYRNGTLDQTLSGTTLSTDVSGLTVGVSTSFQVQAGDAAGNWSAGGPIASVTPTPPDPQLIAPPLDTTVSTTIASTTAFLYTGPNAIQTGVAPGTIVPTRAAVVRGLVRDRASQPLSAVKVSVLGHPEYGNTWTRADGRYDLAVNGGDRITLTFERSDLLPVQRQTTVAWQDYTPLPDVVMVPYDGLLTLMTSNSSQTQVARGSVSIDEIGSRQATVLMPPGTNATLVMPDGSTQSLSTFHVRATEATVGADGPKAMPGPLPATSAYTYAAAFTSDEAVQAGASHIQFSQPVYGYVENFLALPVGILVPSGSYDSSTGRWLPEGNGKVVQILSTSNGTATLDSNGDGQADDQATLDALGVSNAELGSLATLYAPGQILWRVPIVHFSWVDFNFSQVRPPGPDPHPPPPQPAPPVPPICRVGCTIEVQNQVLRENVPLVGTPYELDYTSARVSGRRANDELDVTLPAPFLQGLPANVTICLPNRSPECQTSSVASSVRVDSAVTVSVAGQSDTRTTGGVALGLDTIWRFEWDGRDVYGRELQGEQPVTVRTCYLYPGVGYGGLVDDTFLKAWAQPSRTGVMVAWRGVGTYSGIFDVCTTTTTTIGGWNNKPAGLGGWTLSSNHVLDVPNKTVYRGDGGLQRVDDLNRYVINVVAGGGSGSNLDGVPATSIGFGTVGGVLAGPDGSFYVAVWAFNAYIGRITPDGIFHRIAGRGPTDPKGSTADGIPALQAGLFQPAAMQFGPDGSLYFAERGALRRISPDGYIYTVAGTPPDPTFGNPIGYTADGAQALGALIGISGGSIAIGPDGSVYFAEALNYRVRKVGPDGVLRTLAGSGPTNSGAFSGDGGPATSARLFQPGGVASMSDGSFLIADSCNERIRRVAADGIINTVAGSGGSICFLSGTYYGGDGGPATQAVLSNVASLTAAPDGIIFISDQSNARVRRFAIGATIDSVAGPSGTCTGADCPATQVNLGQPGGIAYGPAGDIYVVANSRVYHLTSAQAAKQIGLTNIVIPSGDASEVYVFDMSGRHLKTLDALTNAQTQVFGYDRAGKLVSITDRDNNVTIIERDGQENPTAIVGPYGQRTTLALDSDGYLHSMANPNSEMVQLFYKPVIPADVHTGGLLSQYTDARNGSAFYEYDLDGFLTKNTEPDGSYHTYSRGGTLPPTTVTRTSALGRTEVFGLTNSTRSDAQTRTTQRADGLTTTQQRKADHSGSVTSPDGTTVTTAELGDPRFGIQAAYTSSTTTRTPSGLTRTESRSRTVTLANAQDPLSLTSLLESLTVNGRTSQSSYNASTRRMTMTSAAGRVTTMDYDALGHVIAISPPGVQPLQLHYDTRGRNDTITQGSRATTLSYRSDGFLDNIVDPLLHRSSFGYDLAGRPSSQTLPDLTVIGMTYDANGNVNSVTPPGRPAHVFAFTSANLERDYTPPDVGQPRTTHTDYNLDQQVSNISRPDADFITPTYDLMMGRLTALSSRRGSNAYGYSPTTGQLTSINTFDGVGLTYGYDGSLVTDVTWSGPISGNVHKTFDSSFRVSSETVTGGQTINFGYDNDDLLTSAGAIVISRDLSTGLATGSALGPISESRTYDAYGAEQTYTVTANGTVLYSADYGTRDALGRIVNKIETVQGETHAYGYAYDGNGRLTDVTKDGALASHYEYDMNGNRLVGPGLVVTPVYDAQDRLVSYGNCTYSYKNDGSLQGKTCPDGATIYDYDAFGNLRAATLPNGTTIAYLIDGQNRRVGKKVNGALVESFRYDHQLNRVAWYDGNGTLKAQFVFGIRWNVPEYMVKAGQNYKFVYDQLGSVRVVVAPDGSISERIDYDEFGNIVADSMPGFQPFGFAAGLRDVDTGLVRFGKRDYDAAIGRWTTIDPTRFAAGPNLFTYVNNDPINMVDPSGKSPYGWAAAGICGLIDIYQFWSLSRELSELEEEILALAEMLRNTERVCRDLEQRSYELEILDRRIAELRSRIRQLLQEQTSRRLRGYALDTLLGTVCVGLSRL
jgi:RHS repeat-associated protein